LNKKRSLQILLALMVFVTAIIASSSIIRAQSSGANVSVTKWDYRLVYVRAYDVQREMDYLADQGFEILEFKVTQFDTNTEPRYHIIFKRRRP